jgi:ribosomal protein S18 acetylase RimI-like enzyme
MRFAIRPAEPADVDAIAEVHVGGWRWGYRGLLPDDLLAGLDAAERAERLLAVMGDAERTVSVHLAEQDGRAVGFVSCGPSREPDADDHTGEIYALYVEEDVAGTGVGTALLRAARAELRARGLDRVVLWVLETNARARRFYEREGWVADGTGKSEEFRGFTLHEVRYAVTN